MPTRFRPGPKSVPFCSQPLAQVPPAAAPPPEPPAPAANDAGPPLLEDSGWISNDDVLQFGDSDDDLPAGATEDELISDHVLSDEQQSHHDQPDEDERTADNASLQLDGDLSYLEPATVEQPAATLEEDLFPPTDASESGNDSQPFTDAVPLFDRDDAAQDNAGDQLQPAAAPIAAARNAAAQGAWPEVQAAPPSGQYADGDVPEVVAGFKRGKVLGKGAMATVYQATQVSLGRKVALKIIPPSALARGHSHERALKEIRCLAGISHPHVVTCFSAGTVRDHLLLAFEYHGGGDLARAISRKTIGNVEQHLAVAMQICDGLIAIHSAGLIHSDINPKNILISSSGHAVIADLGLIYDYEHDDISSAQAKLGTPEYMSPEQVRGEADFDFRADIFGLGATLHHLFSGDSPFRRAQRDTTKRAVLEHQQC